MTDVRSTFLRRLIALDAVACGISGALLAFDANLLEGPLGLSAQFMRPAGLILITFGLVQAALATRPQLSRATVWALVAANALWVVESLALVTFGWAQPTSLGLVVVIVQATAAALVADLQYLALRRARRDAMT